MSFYFTLHNTQHIIALTLLTHFQMPFTKEIACDKVSLSYITEGVPPLEQQPSVRVS